MPHPYKQFYRRKLPHIQSPNASLFVTFRLAGSIPKIVLDQWKEEKVWLETEMDRASRTADNTTLQIDQQQRSRVLDFHRRWFVKFEEICTKRKLVQFG